MMPRIDAPEMPRLVNLAWTTATATTWATNAPMIIPRANNRPTAQQHPATQPSPALMEQIPKLPKRAAMKLSTMPATSQSENEPPESKAYQIPVAIDRPMAKKPNMLLMMIGGFNRIYLANKRTSISFFLYATTFVGYENGNLPSTSLNHCES